MEKQSIKKNYIYNTTFQIVTLLISVITVPYVSRALGVNNVGKYSFANSIASYFILFATFGSSVYGQRQISFCRDSKTKLSESFWDVFVFRFVMTSCMLALYFLYLYFFNQINALNIIIAISIINVAVDINWLFQGLECFKTIAIRNLGVKIVCTSLIFIMVKEPKDLWLYALIMCSSNLAGNMTMWISLKQYIGKPQKIHPFSDFKLIFMVFLPTIAIQIYAVLDKSMIGWITGSDYNNGCYEQAEQIARISLTIVTSIGAVILPRVGNLYKKGDIETAKEYIYKSYTFVWMMSIPMSIGLTAISPVLIPIFLGPGYDGAIILLQIFSLLIVVVSLAYITGYSFLIPTEQQNIYTIAVSASAIVNVIMNLFLISRFQAMGAAISSVTAEAIGLFIQLGYCCITKQLSICRITKTVWKYLLAGFVMYLIVVLFRKCFAPSVIMLIYTITAAVIVYLAAVVLLRDDFTIGLLKQVKQRFKN